MRQWELTGITDTAAPWVSDLTVDPIDVPEVEPSGTFLWSTDGSLRIRVMSETAAAALGLDAYRCEGRDLLSVFGIEGMNLAILEAHIEALQGNEGRFSIEREEGGRIRCRVEPTHAGDGRVIGTFCLATEEEPASSRRVVQLVSSAA